LTYEQADLVQPLAPKDVVGGNVLEATSGTQGKLEGERVDYEADLAKKSLGEKISGTFAGAKDKISSTFASNKESQDKENVSTN